MPVGSGPASPDDTPHAAVSRDPRIEVGLRNSVHTSQGGDWACSSPTALAGEAGASFPRRCLLWTSTGYVNAW